MYREAFALFTAILLSGTLYWGRNVETRAQMQQSNIASISLASDTVSLNEPVIVNFTIHNALSKPLTVDLGSGRKEGFQFTVVGPTGTKTQVKPRVKGISRVGEMTIESGQSFTQGICINEWFQFSVPGKYVVEVELDKPIRIEGERSTIVRSRLSLEVTPRNTGRLKEVCDVFIKQLLNSTSFEEACTAAIPLSYVTDEVAVPYLAQALTSNRMVESFVIDGLERIGNEEAVSLLISALNMGDALAPILAKQSLQKIESESSDPVLRERIKQAMLKK